MVKLFCNRCGEEIKDSYHTINIYGFEVYPKPCDYTTVDYAIASVANSYSTGYGDTREGALAMLNSIEMYCPDCIEEIKDFITYGKSR